MIQATCLTMTDATAQEPLDSEQGDRLIGFARTCAVAVRAVSLYPAKHPAVDAALARLVDCVTTITASEALRATVLPHTLLIDGRAPAKADPALAELATALHLHRISGLTVRNAGDASMWQQLLGLVGRPTEEIREAGGIGHLWSESGGITTAAYLRSVEVREVDYEQLLRNQALGDPLTLEEIFDRLESGTPEAMGSAAQALLAEIAIVLQVHAPDPHRPRVRILRDTQGRRVPSEPTRHLWETRDGAEDDVHVTAPLHADDYGVDPLEYL